MNLFIYLSFVFAFSELLLTFVKRSKLGAAKTRDDRGSMIILWIMITSGFIGGSILAKSPGYFLEVSGFVLIILGLIIRWAAIIQLGKSFTVDVAITNGAELKTDGLYKQVRHPSYSGLLLTLIGFSLTMNSFYSFLVLVIPVFLALCYRISVEEGVLKHEFGESYTRYITETKKLVPGIY